MNKMCINVKLLCIFKEGTFQSTIACFSFIQLPYSSQESMKVVFTIFNNHFYITFACLHQSNFVPHHHNFHFCLLFTASSAIASSLVLLLHLLLAPFTAATLLSDDVEFFPELTVTSHREPPGKAEEPENEVLACITDNIAKALIQAKYTREWIDDFKDNYVSTCRKGPKKGEVRKEDIQRNLFSFTAM